MRHVLIDTSCWIHFLSPDGDTPASDRVSAALETGAARWCAMARLELWNGARGEREKKVLSEFERLIPELATSQDVWDQAFALSRCLRAAGVAEPATDVLIDARATHHAAELEHSDTDFVVISACYDDAGRGTS